MDAHAISKFTSLTEADVDGLAALLIDALDGGASVSFLPPLAHADAAAFWRRQWPPARGGAIFAARDADGRLDGTVILAPAWAPNQPHRAEVAKLLVHRRARRRGVGRGLMRALEQHAADEGFSLLTLDTERGGPGQPTYESLGWIQCGAIPDFAIYADGRTCDTILYYKKISPTSTRR
jgi:GNAT superfamily N-acetyltransferase